jgi:catechol 2,3-dioxygenase-like lactoylglutathione lyase family enzyme
MKKWTLAFYLILGTLLSLKAQSNFTTSGITVGVLVSDLEKSIDFYINVIGMVKAGGFSIDSEFGKKSGLSNGVPFDVTILKLEDHPDASQWKLVSFKKEAAHPAQNFIQDDTGMQYITLYVKSLAPVIERIKAHNIKVLSETPTLLRDGRHFVLIQDPDGTFVELIGPM